MLNKFLITIIIAANCFGLSEYEQVLAQKPLDKVKEEFPYGYIYDLAVNKCVTTDYYKYKFTEEMLKESTVIQIPQRPEELTIKSKDNLYVFTKDLKDCNEARKRFLPEDNKYSSRNIYLDKD